MVLAPTIGGALSEHIVQIGSDMQRNRDAAQKEANRILHDRLSNVPGAGFSKHTISCTDDI